MQFSRYLTYSKSDSAYPIVSWIIKLGLVFASLYYVISKLIEESTAFAGLLKQFMVPAFIGIIVFVLMLMVINWLLEAIKWQFVAKPFSSLSLKQSVKAVVTGISLDAVIPLGAGAVAGKVLSVKYKDRNNLYLPAILAQGLQSFWTVLLGMYGIYQLSEMTKLGEFYSVEKGQIALSVLILSGLVLLIFWPKAAQKLGDTVKVYSISTWTALTVLSFLRYVVFLSQLLLLAHFFSPEIALPVLVGCSNWMFFAKTIVPKPGHIGALGIRGASAIIFLDLAGYPYSGFVLATFALWVINLAIPSLLGLFFIKELHFTAESK